MKSISKVVLIVSIFYFNIGRGQKLEILKRGAEISKYGQDFEIIESNTDTSEYQFVAIIQAKETTSNQSIGKCFFAIRDEAMKMGANAFMISYFSRESKETTLTLRLFYAPITILERNFKTHPKNQVFIFGGEEETLEEYSCKVADKKMIFKSGTFLTFEIPNLGELKVSKGGLTGMTAWYKWKENRPAILLSLSGFGLAGGGVSPNGGVGVGFTTGRLNEIDANLGYLYLRVLKRAN